MPMTVTIEQLEKFLTAESSMYKAKIKQDWDAAYNFACQAIDNCPSRAALVGLRLEIEEISRHMPKRIVLPSFQFRRRGSKTSDLAPEGGA